MNFLFIHVFFLYRAEKEEIQLNNVASKQQQQQQQQQRQQQHLDPKRAFANRTTIVRQQNPTNITYNSNSNKKSLVVNGNGHSSVITSISREKFEQRNRLHL